MSKKLIITGTVSCGKHGTIGAGTNVTEIDVPDETYGLNEKDVQRIIDAGAGHYDDGTQTAQKQNSNPDRLKKLIAAIGKLDPKNKDHYTEDGKPECAAIEKIAGGKVTATERDHAFDIYQAAQVK